MQCEHTALNRVGLSPQNYTYSCIHCGQLLSLDAVAPNSPAPTQSTEPNWTELVQQILPLIAKQAAVQAEAMHMSQVIQAIRALTPLTIADIPGTKTLLKVMIARLDRLLFDVESKDKETPAQ